MIFSFVLKSFYKDLIDLNLELFINFYIVPRKCRKYYISKVEILKYLFCGFDSLQQFYFFCVKMPDVKWYY